MPCKIDLIFPGVAGKVRRITTASVLVAAGAVPYLSLANDGQLAPLPIVCEADQSALAEDPSCLKRFQGIASRKGDLLLLLENRQIKTYRSDREACRRDPNGERCVVFRLDALYPSQNSLLIEAILGDCGAL